MKALVQALDVTEFKRIVGKWLDLAWPLDKTAPGPNSADTDHSWLLQGLLLAFEPQPQEKCPHGLGWWKAHCCNFGLPHGARTDDTYVIVKIKRGSE